MKKILFLDFDGVITTEKSRYNLDREKIDLLGKIIKETDCQIVISSSWRQNTLEQTIKNITTVGDCSRVPFPFPYHDRVVGITIRAYQYVVHGIHLSIPRGVEIKQWIDTHIHSDNGVNWSRKSSEDFRYVILDDDCDMLLEQKDNFVHTDSYEGLSEDDVKRAIEILNGTVN